MPSPSSLAKLPRSQGASRGRAGSTSAPPARSSRACRQPDAASRRAVRHRQVPGAVQHEHRHPASQSASKRSGWPCCAGSSAWGRAGATAARRGRRGSARRGARACRLAGSEKVGTTAAESTSSRPATAPSSGVQAEQVDHPVPGVADDRADQHDAHGALGAGGAIRVMSCPPIGARHDEALDPELVDGPTEQFGGR